jgi:hypothetical protein
MANTIVAGNSTNNGLAVTSDNTGALNILTGSGAGTAAISIDSSQNVTMAANLAVTGNVTVTGTLSATNGVTGSLKSATAQASTSGTSIDFTGIPTGVKRITIMPTGFSTSGTSNLIVQLGTGSTTYTTTGYLGGCGYVAASTAAATAMSTGFMFMNLVDGTAANSGVLTLSLVTGTTWAFSGLFARQASTVVCSSAGSIPLAAALTAVRITTVNGTDTFDAGSINIIYE